MSTRAALPFSIALAAIAAFAVNRATAQVTQGAPATAMREAARLDLDGKTVEARRVIQGVLDTTSDPASKANVDRAMAMSYAFDGDCANTVKYEEQVIAYWKTREQAEPQNAFFQEGEIADEAARVCIDAGDLAAADKWYRTGYELGMKEPAPKTHPASLWDFRLAHALARIAARRGDKAEAERQVAAARKALDSDSAMAVQQERFYPYLLGYVALYEGDLVTAQREFERTLSLRGNSNDPFFTVLLATTYERQGKNEQAMALYRKAYDLARAHNPPAAYVRPLARKKLGIVAPGT